MSATSFTYPKVDLSVDVPSNMPTVVTTSGDIRVDGLSTPDTFGRHKAPPKCDDPLLRKEAKTAAEMSKFAFTPGLPLTLNFEDARRKDHFSSSSSTSSVENGAEKQKVLHKSMLARTQSRQGRDTQRWLTKDKQRVRLVTGCVPILKGGYILFVSASRKLEWILPKGGWEEDETMEESAIRETFEESGVLGTLGPVLSPIQYETRKSKKRRQEMEELIKKSKEAAEGYAAEVTADESKDPVPKKPKENPLEVSVLGDNKKGSTLNIASPSTNGSPETRPPSAAVSILSADAVERIRGTPDRKKRSDETASNASDSSGCYSHVELSMFPLYVSEIRDSWPECGRFRKIVHIDEAIKMTQDREEFRAALLEVKERKLHLVSETAAIQEEHC